MVAAVPDSWADLRDEIKTRIGLPIGARYYNSGVLLINLQLWRRSSIGRRALEFCRRHPESITYGDQCAINYAVAGHVRTLGKKWNFQTYDFEQMRQKGYVRLTQHEAKTAAIIHFTAESKPWHAASIHPMRRLYIKQAKQLGWASNPAEGQTIVTAARRIAIVNTERARCLYRKFRSMGRRIVQSLRTRGVSNE